MDETPLTLYIDLQQGSRIDLEVAAHASIAWSRMIKSIGSRIDPFGEWDVQLQGAEPGSQKIRAYIRRVAGDNPKATIQAAVVAGIVFLGMRVIEWSVNEVLDYLKGPDAPASAQLMSEEDRQKMAEDIVRLLRAEVGQDESADVFEELGKDSAVTGAGSTSNPTKRPSTVIPRGLFPKELPKTIAPDAEKRSSISQVELTLVRAVLTEEPTRRWGFQSQYGYFGAAIQDQVFLSALASGRLNIPLAKGIRMLVEIEITEELDGQIWKPVERTIKRVIKIIPPPMQQQLELDGPE